MNAIKLICVSVSLSVIFAPAQAQTTCQRIGSQTYCSNGLNSQDVGQFRYYNDGTTRQTIGQFQYYSPPAYTPPQPIIQQPTPYQWNR